MQIRPGQRLKSAVCDTEIIVVRGNGDVDLWCGGHPMIATGEEPPPGLSLVESPEGGTLMGKRYADESIGLEVLCTKPGKGALSVAGTPIPVKEAKPLPSSD